MEPLDELKPIFKGSAGADDRPSEFKFAALFQLIFDPARGPVHLSIARLWGSDPQPYQSVSPENQKPVQREDSLWKT